MTLPISRNAGLHVRYEKAGLILDALPIPWNADAVIVEANVRLPSKTPRSKQDFVLQLSNGAAPVPAELIMREKQHSALRVFFRIPPPPETCEATVRWREHLLGEIELPMVALTAFVEGLSLELPTLHVTLGDETVACQAIVHTQAKAIHASAILRGRGPLAPVLGLGLRVHIRDEWESIDQTVHVALTGEQLRARQALVTVRFPKLRKAGVYRVSWHFGPRLLFEQSLRCITQKAFQRSVRITATRFIVHNVNGSMQTVRSLPMRDGALALDGVAQVVPCFYVCSNEPGAVGLVPFTVRALVDDTITTLGIHENFLVTDGPTPIILGAVDAGDAPRIRHFTLAAGNANLGNLALLPTASAAFTAEGGFARMDDYLWSPAAEENLQDRLGKLLGGE
ncbi:MAG: hypothetical protein HYX68_15630 [Planctomycetes bacterium]|nr:hypothetical protein [Planctomycetota bacterium]